MKCERGTNLSPSMLFDSICREKVKAKHWRKRCGCWLFQLDPAIVRQTIVHHIGRLSTKLRNSHIKLGHSTLRLINMKIKPLLVNVRWSNKATNLSKVHEFPLLQRQIYTGPFNEFCHAHLGLFECLWFSFLSLAFWLPGCS